MKNNLELILKDNIRNRIIFIISLLFLAKIHSLSSRNSHFNVLLINNQDNCYFCLVSKSNDLFAFGQCPITKNDSTRYNLIQADQPYMFYIENQNKLLSYENDTEFYILPIFNSKLVIISLSKKRLCLTNSLTSNTIPPYEAAFSTLFTACDYSGLNVSQLFSIEDDDNKEMHKYVVKLYNSSNPANPQKDTLLSQSDINVLIAKNYRIYFSYIDINNRSLEFTFTSNTFTIYLATPPTDTDVYLVNSNYKDLTATYCTYPISYRNQPGNLKVPFFNSNRCNLNPEILLNLGSLNLVTFKIKNATKNIFIDTSAIASGSTINITNTSFSSTFAPFNYVNSSTVSSFQKELDF